MSITASQPNLIKKLFDIAARLTQNDDTISVPVSPQIFMVFRRLICKLGKNPRTYYQVEILTYPLERQRQSFTYDNRWTDKLGIFVSIQAQSLAGNCWTTIGGYRQLRPYHEINEVDPGLLDDIGYYLFKLEDALSRPNLIH